MTKGERIKALREEKGLQQAELATLIGEQRQNMYKYENDIITNIPSDKIELIADVLNTTPQYIMGWDNEPHKIKEIIPHENTSSLETDPEIHVFHTYKKLDTTDKAEIRGEMKHMLKADKYKEEKIKNDTEFAKGFDMVASGGEFIQSGEDDFEML